MFKANLKRASARGQHGPSSLVSRPKHAHTKHVVALKSVAADRHRDGGRPSFQAQIRMACARLRSLPEVGGMSSESTRS